MRRTSPSTRREQIKISTLPFLAQLFTFTTVDRSSRLGELLGGQQTNRCFSKYEHSMRMLTVFSLSMLGGIMSSLSIAVVQQFSENQTCCSSAPDLREILCRLMFLSTLKIFGSFFFFAMTISPLPVVRPTYLRSTTGSITMFEELKMPAA